MSEKKVDAFCHAAASFRRAAPRCVRGGERGQKPCEPVVQWKTKADARPRLGGEGGRLPADAGRAAARPADAEKTAGAGRTTGTQKAPCDDASSHGAFRFPVHLA